MAEGRADKLRRLVRVQRQIERMAENDLSLILREKAKLDDAREALVAAIGSLEPLHQAMSAQYTRRFSGLEAKSQRLAGMRALQEKRLLTERMKADRLDESARGAAEDEAREAQDETLLDLLETVLQTDRDSSPA